jgi:hypothetical protein
MLALHYRPFNENIKKIELARFTGIHNFRYGINDYYIRVDLNVNVLFC